jgi:hypothetical protein
METVSKNKKANEKYEVGFVADAADKNEVPALNRNKASFAALEEFTRLINQPPPKDGVQKTPDGNAETLVISYVETKLDEVYLRQWGTTDVHVQIVANEILVWLTLWVIDPQTKIKIERAGFAAVQITVDRAPDNIKDNKQLKNQWALNLDNKKPNACYLSFPKAKSLAIKNAAQSLGEIFGRGLNRTVEDTPDAFYEKEFEARETIDQITEQLKTCKTREELAAIWNKYPDLHTNQTFRTHFNSYSSKLNLKK